MQRRAIASFVVMTLAGACGGTAREQADASGGPARESVSVEVTVADYVVETEADSVPAGRVTLAVSNGGGFHDLYVLRTDLPAADLPEHQELIGEGHERTPAITVDLGAREIEVVGSIDVLQDGEIQLLAVDLAPGHYALICTLVNFEEVGGGLTDAGSHYALGMRADLSVR